LYARNFKMKTFQSVISTLVLFCISLTMQAQYVIIGGGGNSIGSSQTRQQQTVGEHTSFLVNGNIYGTDDMEEKPYALPNANIQIVCLNDTSVSSVAVSDKKGHFAQYLSVLKKRIKKKEGLKVALKVSYVGYETYVKELKAKERYYDENHKEYGSIFEANADTIVLKSMPMSTEEVQIVGELKRMYESGDTTIFNVDAFEMPRGTVLLNLIRRMPGLRYENDQLTYRDSVIHEIRLNGESFFAHDMKIALENIENEDLKQFRVYKTQADTLSTDTTKHWVADMITKKPVNRVELSKPEIGTTNIKNTYHFQMQNMRWNSGNKGEWSATVSLDDLPNVSSKKYSQNRIEGSFRRQFGKQHYFNINYRPNYNYTDNRNNSETFQSTIMPDYEQYSISSGESKSYNNSTNQNLNFSGRVSKKDNSGYLNSNISYGYSDSQSYSRNTSASYSGNPYGGENNELLDEASLRAIGLNRSSSESQSRSHQQNLNIQNNYSQGFEGNKTFLYPNINIRMNYSNNRSYGSSTERQQTDYLQYGDSVWSYHRQSISPNNTNRLSLSADYGFTLGSSKKTRQHVSFSYEFTHHDNESDRVYYDLTNNHQRLDSISTYERNMTTEHRIGLSYDISIKNFTINQNVTFVPTRQSYEHIRRDGVRADTTVHAPLMNATTSMSYRFKQNRSMSLYYTFRNNLPNLSTLVRPTTNDNPLYIQKANPNLKKTEYHSINLSMYFGEWSLSGSYHFTRNSIASHSIYDTKTGGTVSTYENINGNWGVYGSASYRTDFRHANININANYNFNHQVNYLQTRGTEGGKGASDVHDINITPRFVLYTKHYDLTLDGNYGYQWGNSNYAMSMDKVHTYRLNSALNYWLGNRLTIHTDLNISGQAGSQMSEGNRTDFMWNMGIEYKVLRDYRGLLKLTWYDILRERTNYNIDIGPTGRYEYRSSGNPHYVLLTFQYKLYKMK